MAAAAPEVTVVQALPKSDRSELAVELATEAGADAFVAWQSDRCVARWDGPAKVEKGLRRWQAVARSAARQSRRPHVPPVTALVSTSELAAHGDGGRGHVGGAGAARVRDRAVDRRPRRATPSP